MMTINKLKLGKKLITHNGSFHADDIFACATLCLMLEKNNEDFEIIRTRDEEIIKNGDYVFDVGGVYDIGQNRFDHHQVGGAGRRMPFGSGGEKGIEYSSFGLIWKKFGIKICDNQKIVDFIDERLVSPVDAGDNGFNLVENKYNISPYYIQNLFNAMRLTWMEKNENTLITDEEMFLKCVEIAKVILTREIIQAEHSLLAEEKIIEIYKNTKDKQIIILDKNYPSEHILNSFPEPLFIIYPREADKFWGVKAVRENLETFVNKKNFPKSWAGLRDEELQNVTGVRDAVFCHRALFLAVARSKEGAIKLAQIAVE